MQVGYDNPIAANKSHFSTILNRGLSMNKAAILSFLAFLIISGAFIINPVQVRAQTEVDVSAFISLEPVVVWNQAVWVNVRLEPAPPTDKDIFHGVTVNVTGPDGLIETLPVEMYANGSGYSVYVPRNQVGTYLFQLVYLGQSFADGAIVYRPALSQIATLSVTAPPASTSVPTIEPDGGSWATKASMPTARWGLGAAVVDDKIYAIGGSTLQGSRPSAGGVVGKNEQYDPTTNKWSSKASMPTPRSNFAIAVYENKIYCIGGTTNGGYTAVNEVYDPLTNTWETKTSMLTTRGSLQANVVDNKIYLIGGFTSDNSSFGASTLSVNEVYDPVTDTWTQKVSSPFAIYGYASAVIDHKIYFICGSNDGQITALNQIYDTQTDTWTMGTSAPTYFMSGYAVATTGVMVPKLVYVFNQPATKTAANSNVPLYSNQIYDPKTDSWMAGADLPTNRADFAVAVVNDTIYVIGGQTSTYDMFTGYSVMPKATNEHHIPAGYGTSDRTYQTSTPSLTPSFSPTLSPTSAPTLSPSQSPSPSATATASQQPTQSSEFNPITFPAQTTYVIAVTVTVIAIIAVAAIVFRKKRL